MTVLRNICVYCGSADGVNPEIIAAADMLGQEIGAAGYGLVYGGGNRGLMGRVARATLRTGGRVIGIIPEFLESREHALPDAQELIVVSDMHTRKRLMFERADAFVALPGGAGTLEELVEQLTWLQLGRHTKPVVIADIAGFWRPLLSLFAHMRQGGFIRPEYELHYLVAQQVKEILPMITMMLVRQEKTGLKIKEDQTGCAESGVKSL